MHRRRRGLEGDAVGYYERFGFKRFDRTGPRSDTVPMFLGLRTIQSAMGPET